MRFRARHPEGWEEDGARDSCALHLEHCCIATFQNADSDMTKWVYTFGDGKAEGDASLRNLLGGKGANVIFADADDKAVKRGVLHLMNNSGQSCNAPSRMLVERSFYDQAVEIAAEVANAVKVGPASEHGRHIGPVVNKRQWDQIQG